MRGVIKQGTELLRESVVGDNTLNLLCSKKPSSHAQSSQTHIINKYGCTRFSLAILTINYQAFLFSVVALFTVKVCRHNLSVPENTVIESLA